MTPTAFEGQNCTIGASQPEYLPLPAHRDREGTVTTCWALSWRERLRLLFTGRMWWQQMTFHGHLQPQRPSVERPL